MGSFVEACLDYRSLVLMEELVHLQCDNQMAPWPLKALLKLRSYSFHPMVCQRGSVVDSKSANL